MVSMRIFVTSGRKMHNILVDSDDQVITVKEELEQTAGIPVDQQELIWSGKRLQDDKPFRYYGIRAGGFFNLKTKA